MNRIVLPLIIVLVGGLAVFPIYLQQDKAIVEISNVINPEYHCLDKWNVLSPKMAYFQGDRLTDAEGEIFLEYVNSYCQYKFREWLPQDHKDWGFFVELESYNQATCEKIKQSGKTEELDPELIEGLKKTGCNIEK